MTMPKKKQKKKVVKKQRAARRTPRVQNKNLKPPFKKGESGNPKGRTKGQRDYVTIYKEAIRKIAETKNMTPEQVEDLMTKTGLDKALKGDYAFYRDTLDRLHGKPLQKGELELSGKISLSGLYDEAERH